MSEPDTAYGSQDVLAPPDQYSQASPYCEEVVDIFFLNHVAKAGESLHALDLSPGKDFILDLKSPRPNRRPDEPRWRKPALSKQLTTKVEQLLKAKPAGIWASRFQLEYKERYDEDLPVASMGFTSVVSFLSSLPVCELERPSGMGDWVVFAKGQLEHKDPDLRRSMPSEAIVTDTLARSIQVVLKAHPGGILLTEFPQAFKDMLKDKLPVEELGFKSVVELVRQVPQVGVSTVADSGQIMVQLLEEKKEEEEEGEGEGEGLDKETKQEPKEKPPRPSSYTPQLAPKDTKTCGVYVTWVKTPSCMSVQLIGEPTTKSLEYLQEDIAQFYSSPAGVQCKIEDPQIGQPCCTIFANDGYWYRAEIVALPAPDIAEVKYVDYGNVGQVPRASLRKPKPHYLALPAQAVDCRLANLRPAGSSWSKRATQLLFQMTKEKPLVALITSITNNCMSVCLCDTTTARDIHINDSLVSQGLALFMPDSPEDREGFDGYQLEGSPVETTGDVLPEIRPPSTAGVLADLGAQQRLAASQLQLQYLQQLLLLQQHNARLMAPPLAPPTIPLGAQSMPPLLVPPTIPLGAQPVAPPGLPSKGLGVAVSESHGQGGQKGSLMSQQGGAESQVLSGIDPLSPLQTPAQSQPPPRPSGPSQTGDHMEPKVTRESSKPPSRKGPLRTASTSSVQSRNVCARPQTEPRTEELPVVKRVELTRSHCLHVMRYNGRGYVASCEVSQWFWDSDLLQSMLRQVQTPIWGLLLEQWKTPSIFAAIRRTRVGHLLYKRKDMTVYSLDDLPTIVTTFPCGGDVREAVRREVECWQREGLQYFSKDAEARRARAEKEREMEVVQAALADLQAKRKSILMAMCQQSDDDGSFSLDKLIKVEDGLKETKKRITELEKELGGAITTKSGQPQSPQKPDKTVPLSISQPLQPTKPPDLHWLSVSTSSSSQSSPTPGGDAAGPSSPSAGVETIPFQSAHGSVPSLSVGGDELPVRQSLPSSTANTVLPPCASALDCVDSRLTPPSPATNTDAINQSPPTSSGASVLGLPPPASLSATDTVSHSQPSTLSYASAVGHVYSHPTQPLPAIRDAVPHLLPTSLPSSFTVLHPTPCAAGGKPMTTAGPISSQHSKQQEAVPQQQFPDQITAGGPPSHKPTSVDSLTASLANTSISSPPPSFPDITAALLGLGRGKQANVNKPPQCVGLGRGRLRRVSCEPVIAAVAPGQASFPSLPPKEALCRPPLLPLPIVPGPRRPPFCPQPGPIMAAFPPSSAPLQAYQPQLKAAAGLGRGSERRHSASLGRGSPAPGGTGRGEWLYIARARRRGGGASRSDFPPIGSAAGLDII